MLLNTRKRNPGRPFPIALGKSEKSAGKKAKKCSESAQNLKIVLKKC